MVDFLTGASAMVLVWQQFAAATGAISSVPLQIQTSLPSQLCNEGTGVSLSISSGVLWAGYFQSGEHISVQLFMPSLPQNHTSLSLLSGCLGDREITLPRVGGQGAETEISQVQQGWIPTLWQGHQLLQHVTLASHCPSFPSFLLNYITQAVIFQAGAFPVHSPDMFPEHCLSCHRTACIPANLQYVTMQLIFLIHRLSESCKQLF